MKNILLVTLLLIQTIITTAQTRHLVPYRLKNHWGFSDTLGKIVIHPKYDSTDFFGDLYNISSEIGRIFTTGKQGIISFDRKIIVPALYDEIVLRGEDFVVRQKTNYGLYAAQGILGVAVKYEAVEAAGYYGSSYFLTLNKKRGLYDSKTGKLIPAIYDTITDDFFSEKVDGNKWFYATKGASRFLIDRKSFKIVSYKDANDPSGMGMLAEGVPPIEELQTINTENDDIKKIKKKFEADDVTVYEKNGAAYTPNIKIYKVKKAGKTGLAFANTLTLLSPVYDSVSYVIFIYRGSNYLNKKSFYLIAAKKGDYFGLVNEGEEEMLPFQYDMIRAMPSYVYAFVTTLKGRQGVFLPTTFYPPIAPKYDVINYETSLQVGSNWSFAIFKTVTNGKAGYVGENGVEYYTD